MPDGLSPRAAQAGEAQALAATDTDTPLSDTPGLGLRPRRQAAFFRIREHLSPPVRWAFAAAPFVLLFVLWFWGTVGDDPATRRIAVGILPSPGEVASSLGSLWNDRSVPTP